MSKYVTRTWSAYDKKEYLRKHCPFCGERAILYYFEELGEESSNYYYAGEKLTCEGCGISYKEYNPDAQYEPSMRISMRNILKKRWNKRTHPEETIKK